MYIASFSKHVLCFRKTELNSIAIFVFVSENFPSVNICPIVLILDSNQSHRTKT